MNLSTKKNNTKTRLMRLSNLKWTQFSLPILVILQSLLKN